MDCPHVIGSLRTDFISRSDQYELLCTKEAAGVPIWLCSALNLSFPFLPFPPVLSSVRLLKQIRRHRGPPLFLLGLLSESRNSADWTTLSVLLWDCSRIKWCEASALSVFFSPHLVTLLSLIRNTVSANISQFLDTNTNEWKLSVYRSSWCISTSV